MEMPESGGSRSAKHIDLNSFSLNSMPSECDYSASRSVFSPVRMLPMKG